MDSQTLFMVESLTDALADAVAHGYYQATGSQDYKNNYAYARQEIGMAVTDTLTGLLGVPFPDAEYERDLPDYGMGV